MSRSQTPLAIIPSDGPSSSRNPSPRPAIAHTVNSGLVRLGLFPQSRNQWLTACWLEQSGTAAYSLLDPEETNERLTSSLTHGLSPSVAETRFLQNGPNELPHEEPEALWLRFVKQFKETLILLLLASAVISYLMGNLDDAVSITIAVTIVVTVGFVQEYRSEKSLEALNKLVPYYAHVIRGSPNVKGRPDRAVQEQETSIGIEMTPLMDSSGPASSPFERSSTTIPASKLVIGDLVIFATGDRIPADIRITKAAELSIDESNLTGENEPALKQIEALDRPLMTTTPGRPSSPSYASPAAGTVGADIRLNEQTNIAFMGTLVRSGHGQGLVVSTGAGTEFGGISASLQEIESPRTPLQLSMDRLGQELSYMSFAVIGVIMVVGIWQGRHMLEMFTIGVSLAVAAIPEGLPIIVTVTLALGVLRMAKQGAIVRRLPSVETLGSVNVVCSDKTGMIPFHEATVEKSLKCGRYSDAQPHDRHQALAL